MNGLANIRWLYKGMGNSFTYRKGRIRENHTRRSWEQTNEERNNITLHATVETYVLERQQTSSRLRLDSALTVTCAVVLQVERRLSVFLRKKCLSHVLAQQHLKPNGNERAAMDLKLQSMYNA